MCFLVLYVDDILLIGNDVAALSIVKVWLASTFNMKDPRRGKLYPRDKDYSRLVAKDNGIISS